MDRVYSLSIYGPSAINKRGKWRSEACSRASIEKMVGRRARSRREKRKAFLLPSSPRPRCSSTPCFFSCPQGPGTGQGIYNLHQGWEDKAFFIDSFLCSFLYSLSNVFCTPPYQTKMIIRCQVEGKIHKKRDSRGSIKGLAPGKLTSCEEEEDCVEARWPHG